MFNRIIVICLFSFPLLLSNVKAEQKTSISTTSSYVALSIPEAVVDQLLGMAATEWNMPVEDLVDAYEDGDLTITDNGDGSYTLTLYREGDPIIITAIDID